MNKLLYDTEEACAALGVRPTLLRELVMRGAVESVRVGRRRLIPVDALESYVRRLRESEREAAGAER